MDKVHFLFGVHNHQPIGNFEFVFEKAYQQAYLPFLDAMERHPRLHWNLHDPGILWDRLEYTLLDDSHFLMAGMTEAQLDGSFITEEQGLGVKLLQISKSLRYAIPFRDPGETLNVLRRFVTPTGYRALTMFDDGEKFG